MIVIPPRKPSIFTDVGDDIYRFTPPPPKPLIVSSKLFTAGFTPPDYLIDGIIQRRYLYSLTGATGAGKTAIALLLAAHVAMGEELGDIEVEKGKVLYFAGENPDDLRMRWIALSEHLGFDREKIDVHFIVGAEAHIEEIRDRIAKEVIALGGVSLIIVDTSAAYFNCEECRDENDNKQAGDHARMFRSLVTLEKGPTVLVLAHPAKDAKVLVPRGGGAFLAEVDGNLTARKSDNLVELHWHGKFRGPEFDPLSFQLPIVTAKGLKDSKDRPIPTVIAVPLTDEEVAAIEVEQSRDIGALLVAIAKVPGQSLLALAKGLGWEKRRVQTVIGSLKKNRLVAIDPTTKRYALTKAGHEQATKLAIDTRTVPDAG